MRYQTIARAGIVTVLAVWAHPAAAQQVPTVTLDEAIELALRVQPTVIQARGDVRVAQAARREAMGSWLPTLTGNSSFSRNSASRFNQETQTFVSASASNSYSAGLTASLQLFDGFRRSAASRSAGADAVSADADLVAARFDVVLQTKQVFFNAVAAEELVRVAQARIQSAQEQLKISKDKLAAGSATRSDTLRGTVELANARLQLLNAETQLSNAHASLSQLIGYDGPVRTMSDSALFTLASLDTIGLREELLQGSPFIQATDAAAKAAGAQVAVSRAQYFPTINASYSPSWSGSSLDQLRNSWSLRLNMSWSLFNGFSRESNVARASASRDAAEARVEDARRLAMAQLTQDLAALTSAQARIGIAGVSLAAAGEDLRVQRERYRLGAATLFEVLTTQESLDQAAVDRVQARLDFLIARAQLEALLGREL